MYSLDIYQRTWNLPSSIPPGPTVRSLWRKIQCLAMFRFLFHAGRVAPKFWSCVGGGLAVESLLVVLAGPRWRVCAVATFQHTRNRTVCVWVLCRLYVVVELYLYEPAAEEVTAAAAVHVAAVGGSGICSERNSRGTILNATVNFKELSI